VTTIYHDMWIWIGISYFVQWIWYQRGNRGTGVWFLKQHEMFYHIRSEQVSSRKHPPPYSICICGYFLGEIAKGVWNCTHTFIWRVYNSLGHELNIKPVTDSTIVIFQSKWDWNHNRWHFINIAKWTRQETKVLDEACLLKTPVSFRLLYGYLNLGVVYGLSLFKVGVLSVGTYTSIYTA
jgi:hypothetical protein